MLDCEGLNLFVCRYCMFSVGFPAGRRRMLAARAECGDDRTFRHILPFSLSYGRVGARIHDD